MGLRIHFSTDDIAKTTVADEPDPLWEVLLSLHLMQTSEGSVVFDRWRQQARTSRHLSRLTALAPPRGYSPDFLTPDEGRSGFDAGVEALLHTPKTRLANELTKLNTKRRLADWGELASGNPKALDELATSLRAYYHEAISPHWSTVRAAVATDRVSRLHAIHTGGNQRLLATLHPKIRWLAPILELHGRHVAGDLHLNGRGLRIIPSYFAWRAPTVLEDKDLPPVLVYPVDRQLALTAGTTQPDNSALVALLGATRAEVLLAADGCTTTDLGAKVGISAASASYHATILRNAGLLTTKRIGSSVKHTRSALGQALLNQANPRP